MLGRVCSPFGPKKKNRLAVSIVVEKNVISKPSKASLQ